MDANGKFPSGFLTGKIRSIGRLEQCVNSKHPLGNYAGKYCLMHLNFTISQESRSTSSKWNEIINEVMGYRRNLEKGIDWNNVSRIVQYNTNKTKKKIIGKYNF